MSGTCSQIPEKRPPRHNYLDHQRYVARRQGAWAGMAVGCVVSCGLMVVLHLALLAHSDAIHERAVATIRAANAIQLDECKTIVRDLAEEEYDVVVNYRNQIDKIQHGRN